MSKRYRPAAEYEMGEYTGRVGRATKRYVKRCMKTMLEHKSAAVANIIGAAPTATGRVDPIQTFIIGQGITDADRTGNFIKLDKVCLRFLATLATDGLSSSYRVIIFRDKQVNGAVPAITDLVTTGTGGMFGGFNPNNVVSYGGTRFQVLREYMFNLTSPNGNVTTSAVTQKAWKVTIKNPGPVQYDATAIAITDIVSGELFVASFASVASSLVQAQVQILYHDN